MVGIDKGIVVTVVFAAMVDALLYQSWWIFKPQCVFGLWLTVLQYCASSQPCSPTHSNGE